jgi:hypothetical protein
MGNEKPKPHIVSVPLADGCWDDLSTFPTREAALAFVREVFGADDQGRVCLITPLPVEAE